MVVVFFDFVVHHNEFDSCLLEHFYSVIVSVIASFTDYSLDSGVYYHHGASFARGHFAEKCGVFKRYAKSGSLDNRVLFGVKGAHTVLAHVAVKVRYFANVMPCVVAVGQTRRGSDVTRGHDSFVFDNHAAAASPVASRAFGNRFAEVQKVSVPIGSSHAESQYNG